jgi:carbon starvation protein
VGAAAAQAPQLIFNDRLDAALTLFFLITVWVLIVETTRICYASLSGRRCPPLAETPHVPTRLAEG